MAGLIDSIYKNYRERNQLYSVIIELTYRCVCRCVHCYIDEHHSDELSTDEIRAVLRQLAEEGVVGLSLTGGEVFVRDDLEAILEEACRNGFLTTVLTTGILIDESAADMMKKNRVGDVEISIMGANASTHDSIMRHPGAFEAMLRAVRLLKARGINVVLKNSILKQNYTQLEDMAALAASMECLFNASLTVLPTIAGGGEPQGYALDYDTARSLNPKLVNGGLAFGEDSSNGAILGCNAGKINCAISPFGDVYPCLIWRRSIGNVREKCIKDIWHGTIDPYLSDIRDSKREESVECFACPSRNNCRRCPGMAFSETGDFRAPVASACRLAGKK